MTLCSPVKGMRRSRAGFTLVELMVAITISILLLVLLVNLSVQSMDVTKRTNESSQSVSAASAALDMIAVDLESLAAGLPGSEYLQTQVGSVGNIPNVTQLTFLTISPIDSDGNIDDQGQVRAVRYRLVQMDPITEKTDSDALYGLYRTAVSATETFAKVIGQPDLSVAGGFPSTPPAVDFLVPNVVEFQIAFYRAVDPASAGGGTSSGSSAKPINQAGNDAYSAVRLSRDEVKVAGGVWVQGRPTSAEITLTILDESGAQLFRKGKISLEDAITRYGRRAARRVNLTGLN